MHHIALGWRLVLSFKESRMNICVGVSAMTFFTLQFWKLMVSGTWSPGVVCWKMEIRVPLNYEVAVEDKGL